LEFEVDVKEILKKEGLVLLKCLYKEININILTFYDINQTTLKVYINPRSFFLFSEGKDKNCFKAKILETKKGKILNSYVVKVYDKEMEVYSVDFFEDEVFLLFRPQDVMLKGVK